jgi:hypothetical protein
MEHLDTLIEADKDASESFKRGFDGREIALEVIKGKSKNFNKLMNADTSAMSLSFTIFRPFNLSASAFAIAIKSCNSCRLLVDNLLNSKCFVI